jgi:hypothetical protein
VHEPLHPGGFGFFEQDQRAGRVDFVVVDRMADRVADAAAGEVEDEIDPGDERPDQAAVPEVPFVNGQSRIVEVVCEICPTAGGEIVEDPQRGDPFGEDGIDEVRADEPRPPP